MIIKKHQMVTDEKDSFALLHATESGLNSWQPNVRCRNRKLKNNMLVNEVVPATDANAWTVLYK
jgi:hypothetical protein